MTTYDSYDQIKIGTLPGNLVPVTALTYNGALANCPPPRTQFQEATEFDEVANGGIKMLGLPVVIWEWPNGLPSNARRALRAYSISGMSALVYIQTPDQAGDVKIYQATMQWPREPAAWQAFDMTAPFSVKFVRCIEVTP